MNTTSQGNNAQNSTTSQPEKTVDFGYRCAANALTALWDKSADNLTTDELRWFAGLTESAKQESSNLHELLMSLGVLMGGIDNSSKPCDDTLAAILFGAADQAATISALAGIADSALDRLQHPEFCERAQKSPATD